MRYNGTNYHLSITVKEYDKLKKIQNKYKDLLDKQKNAISSIIRVIIKNTYSFLYNNLELYFDRTFVSIKSKKTYKKLDYNFFNEIKRNKKKDIINLAILHYLKEYDEPHSRYFSEIADTQFRLVASDNDLFTLIETNRNIYPNFLTSLIRYFLYSPFIGGIIKNTGMTIKDHDIDLSNESKIEYTIHSIENESKRNKEDISKTILKLIENAYIYLNNRELELEPQILDILPNNYLSESNKLLETSFIKLLIRYIIINSTSTAIGNNDYKQIIEKISDNDYSILSTLIGYENINNDEYMQTIFDCIITKKYERIHSYIDEILIRNSINDKRFVIIGNKKYKILGIKKGSIKYFDILICIDAFTNEFKELSFEKITSNIHETYECFNPNKYDLEILKQYQALNEIEIKCNILDTEFAKQDNLLNESNIKSDRIITKDLNGQNLTLKIKYSPSIINHFQKLKNSNVIDYLNYSSNYNSFNRLCIEYKNSK